MKKEMLPFNIPQCDFMFGKIDTKKDKVIDAEEWANSIQDDRK